MKTLPSCLLLLSYLSAFIFATSLEAATAPPRRVQNVSPASDPPAETRSPGTTSPCGASLPIGARVRSIPKDPQTQQNCATVSPPPAPAKIPASQSMRPGPKPDSRGMIKYSTGNQGAR